MSVNAHFGPVCRLHDITLPCRQSTPRASSGVHYVHRSRGGEEMPEYPSRKRRPHHCTSGVVVYQGLIIKNHCSFSYPGGPSHSLHQIVACYSGPCGLPSSHHSCTCKGPNTRAGYTDWAIEASDSSLSSTLLPMFISPGRIKGPPKPETCIPWQDEVQDAESARTVFFHKKNTQDSRRFTIYLHKIPYKARGNVWGMRLHIIRTLLRFIWMPSRSCL
jgi:hypothetical protein